MKILFRAWGPTLVDTVLKLELLKGACKRKGLGEVLDERAANGARVLKLDEEAAADARKHLIADGWRLVKTPAPATEKPKKKKPKGK